MESSDDDTESGSALQSAYSLTDMLDELSSETASTATTPTTTTTTPSHTVQREEEEGSRGAEKDKQETSEEKKDAAQEEDKSQQEAGLGEEDQAETEEESGTGKGALNDKTGLEGEGGGKTAKGEEGSETREGKTQDDTGLGGERETKWEASSGQGEDQLQDKVEGLVEGEREEKAEERECLGTEEGRVQHNTKLGEGEAECKEGSGVAEDQSKDKTQTEKEDMKIGEEGPEEGKEQSKGHEKKVQEEEGLETGGKSGGVEAQSIPEGGEEKTEKERVDLQENNCTDKVTLAQQRDMTVGTGETCKGRGEKDKEERKLEEGIGKGADGGKDSVSKDTPELVTKDQQGGDGEGGGGLNTEDCRDERGMPQRVDRDVLHSDRRSTDVCTPPVKADSASGVCPPPATAAGEVVTDVQSGQLGAGEGLTPGSIPGGGGGGGGGQGSPPAPPPEGSSLAGQQEVTAGQGQSESTPLAVRGSGEGEGKAAETGEEKAAGSTLHNERRSPGASGEGAERHDDREEKPGGGGGGHGGVKEENAQAECVSDQLSSQCISGQSGGSELNGGDGHPGPTDAGSAGVLQAPLPPSSHGSTPPAAKPDMRTPPETSAGSTADPTAPVPPPSSSSSAAAPPQSPADVNGNSDCVTSIVAAATPSGGGGDGDESDESRSSSSETVWRRKKAIKRRRARHSGGGGAGGSSASASAGESSMDTSSTESSGGDMSPQHGSRTPEHAQREAEQDAEGSHERVEGKATTTTTGAGVAGDDEDKPVSPRDENSGYEPIEFRPLPAAGSGSYPPDEDFYANVPDSAIYENVSAMSDFRRGTLRRGATLKGMVEQGGDPRADVTFQGNLTLQGSRKLVKVLPDEHPSRSRESLPDLMGGSRGRTLARDGDDIYESISFRHAPISPLTPSAHSLPDYDDYSWGSSEFESYDDEPEDTPHDNGHKPISVTVEVKSRSPTEPTNQNVLNKLAARIGPRSRSRDDSEEASTYVEVTLNMEKHPPPELPPAPPDLSAQQVKRRHIVASIVDSERSYTESLRRIIDDYEKPLLEAKPQIINKNSIKVIFYRMRDIVQCHNMFHIELAECIRVWDSDEQIGNVFTASFSKSMVFDAYSEFINNFTIAMETAKKLAKQKQAFADFLKSKMQTSPDKLSLFGLMVKPVQRFPQFILCLQDLLKHTSREHHDRLALQLALTELETLTHKLNEMKRESEDKHEVKKVLGAMAGRCPLKAGACRRLVRQDDMVQLDSSGSSNKTKPRRLFLLNDQLICTTVVQKDGDTGMAGKFKFKWSIPVRDVEVVESELPDLYQVQGGPGRSLIVAPKLDRSTFSPWKKELDDMMHDLAIIEQMSNLTSQLRLSYQGLGPDMLFGIQRSLQLAIQDQGDVDQCVLHLSLPTKLLQTSTDKIKEEVTKHIPHKTKPVRANRMLHTFQVQSASIKQDWLLELKNSKLALDPSNKPGWLVPETHQGHGTRLPLFVKPLLIDITKQETKMQCAIAVILPSYTNRFLGMQHLWVCSNEATHSQITLVALHPSQPHVLESFTAYDAAILCAEFVPGFATTIHEHAFAQDTVWMATDTNELCVRNVVEEERSAEPLVVLDTDGRVTCMRFMDSRLYVGLEDGHLAVYYRDQDGVWLIEERMLVKLADTCVSCLLPLSHQMWAACGRTVYIVHVMAKLRDGHLKQDIRKTSHEVGSEDEDIMCMVKAGVGLMVSFRGRGVIRIYHQETFNHLQDVNIASAVAHILDGKDLGDLGIDPRRVAITFLLASKGLLWIGTDCGCTLTLPLPRLEGVPQIKGRPSVSYHAHLGPIRFIVPIHCGASQLHPAPTSPQSMSHSPGCSLDLDTENHSERLSMSEGNADQSCQEKSITIEGATESDTNCDDDLHEQPEEQESRRESAEMNGDLLNQLSEQRSQMEYASSSMLQLTQQGTMGRTRWTSTPDLRHGSIPGLNDSEENVTNLYTNLLQGAEYEHYEDELMGAQGRRLLMQTEATAFPFSDANGGLRMVPPNMAQPGGRRGSSKYATLPVVMEDSSVHDVKEKPDEEATGPTAGKPLLEQIEASGQHVSPGLPHTPEYSPQTPSPAQGPPSRSSSVMEGHAPLGPRQSTISRSHKALSKSLVIVTGGEGHINWAEENAGDTKYDDICLLLWQCRL